MKLYFLLSFFLSFSLLQKEPPLIAEAYKLVNDINAAEKRKAIYMCQDVNTTWKDYLLYKPKDKRDIESHQKRIDTITKYLGHDKGVLLKNIPQVTKWSANITTEEFVDCTIFDVDIFFKTHEYTGVYYYSEPLFNNNKNKALVYIWYITGSLGISASYHYCEKENGVWKKKKIINALGGFSS